MITKDFSSDEDLLQFLTRPDFEPVRYRHIKRGSTYLVISQDEYRLTSFSAEGSFHDIPYNGRILNCELQFSGDGTKSRYAGSITVYICEKTGKGWIRPTFEFNDGRFEKVI